MILGYIICLVLAFVAFLLTSRLGLSIRVAIALAAALVPAIILTAWIMHVGDKPLPDATTIAPGSNSATQKGDALSY